MRCGAGIVRVMQDRKIHFRPAPPAQVVRLLFLAAGIFLLQACALDAATSGRVVVRDRAAETEARLDSRDRAVIEEYYRHAKPKPGPAKREPPSGLAKGKRLPDGLQGRGLPTELERRLSTLPRPYVRLIIGGDIVLLNQETRMINDIMPGVARP